MTRQTSAQPDKARLIAAAPELYEAAKLVYDDLRRDGSMSGTVRRESWQALESAVAKVEGAEDD